MVILCGANVWAEFSITWLIIITRSCTHEKVVYACGDVFHSENKLLMTPVDDGWNGGRDSWTDGVNPIITIIMKKDDKKKNPAFWTNNENLRASRLMGIATEDEQFLLGRPVVWEEAMDHLCIYSGCLRFWSNDGQILEGGVVYKCFYIWSEKNNRGQNAILSIDTMKTTEIVSIYV